MRPASSNSSSSSSSESTPKKDYYEVLGVATSANAMDIKVAYFRMAKKYHPDANPEDAEAASKFQAVAEAFEVLGDEEKRGNYDAFGMDGQGGGGGGGKKQAKKKGVKEDLFGDDEEIKEFHDRVFRQFAADFHESGVHPDPDVAREFGVSKFGNEPTKQKGLDLSFADAVGGCTNKVPLNLVEDCFMCNGYGTVFKSGKNKCKTCSATGRSTFVCPATGQPMRAICPECNGERFIIRNPCSECDGKGRILWRKIYPIPIPAGVYDGQAMQVRICESDVLLLLRVGDSDKFTRNGADVTSHASISVAQALLGGRRKIDGIYDNLPVFNGAEVAAKMDEGPTSIDIPAGTSSHDVIVAEGRGIKKLGSADEFGDHIVNVVIDSPAVITERQRTLMEEYAKLEMGREGTVNVRGGESEQEEATN